MKLWQVKPLEARYPILSLGCIYVKVRDSGAVRNRAVYLAIGVNMICHKELLGLLIAQTEGAKFWLQVVTELANISLRKIIRTHDFGLNENPFTKKSAHQHPLGKQTSVV
jgi:putative transposase